MIRCQRLQAAEMIGQRLEERLRQALLSPALAEQLSVSSFRYHLWLYFALNLLMHFVSPSQASSALPLQRPLLVLADRTVDLTSVLHHTWTYQALVADLLDMKLNRVKVKNDEGVVHWQDLDSATDPTWHNFATAIFPKVRCIVHSIDPWE